MLFYMPSEGKQNMRDIKTYIIFNKVLTRYHHIFEVKYNMCIIFCLLYPNILNQVVVEGLKLDCSKTLPSHSLVGLKLDGVGHVDTRPLTD